jgi:hypothetical protein
LLLYTIEVVQFLQVLCKHLGDSLACQASA